MDCTWVFIVFGFIFEDSDNNSWYRLSFSLYTEVRGEKWGSSPLSWLQVIETMVCQSTVIVWPLICTLCCFRATIFQVYSFSYAILPAIHKRGQSIEQVSPKKCVCQRSRAVNCTHSHHNTFELSEGCFLQIDHSVESSFLICVPPTPAESFSSPLLSIDPCNKPNNAIFFPFMYFISDLFMSESSIVWIVCVKLSLVASGI